LPFSFSGLDLEVRKEKWGKEEGPLISKKNPTKKKKKKKKPKNNNTTLGEGKRYSLRNRVSGKECEGLESGGDS